MTAKECIMGRRSIRSFTDQSVSHELIKDIVESASYAPRWKHTQIVRYVAVEGELKDKVAACTSAYARNGEIIATSEGYTTKAACENGIASVRKNAPEAPVVEE